MDTYIEVVRSLIGKKIRINQLDSGIIIYYPYIQSRWSNIKWSIITGVQQDFFIAESYESNLKKSVDTYPVDKILLISHIIE